MLKDAREEKEGKTTQELTCRMFRFFCFRPMYALVIDRSAARTAIVKQFFLFPKNPYFPRKGRKDKLGYREQSSLRTYNAETFLFSPGTADTQSNHVWTLLVVCFCLSLFSTFHFPLF